MIALCCAHNCCNIMVTSTSRALRAAWSAYVLLRRGGLRFLVVTADGSGQRIMSR